MHRDETLEALDLLIERQRRTAKTHSCRNVRAPWPVVPGWQPPAEEDD